MESQAPQDERDDRLAMKYDPPRMVALGSVQELTLGVPQPGPDDGDLGS